MASYHHGKLSPWQAVTTASCLFSKLSPWQAVTSASHYHGELSLDLAAWEGRVRQAVPFNAGMGWPLLQTRGEP